MSWATRWVRASRPTSRSPIRRALRRIVIGGLGIRLVRGVGLPESIALALEAPSVADVSDPQGRAFRAFAELTRSDLKALAACIRGSRQTLSPEEVALISAPALVAVGTTDTIAGSAHELAALMPNARALDIPGRDHMLAGGRQGVQGGRGAVPSRAIVTSLHESFRGAAGNRLAADVFGDPGRPVLLLHGGGQTRHAWRRTAVEIARAGMTAYAVDQRGHGDSEWVADGAYRFKDFADDVTAVAAELTRRHGEPPVAIGASLGGIASLLAAGEAKDPIFAALVLVDITPRVDLAGVAKVQGFMRAHAHEGFRLRGGSRGCGRRLSAAPAAARARPKA